MAMALRLFLWGMSKAVGCLFPPETPEGRKRLAEGFPTAEKLKAVHEIIYKARTGE